MAGQTIGTSELNVVPVFRKFLCPLFRLICALGSKGRFPSQTRIARGPWKAASELKTQNKRKEK